MSTVSRCGGIRANPPSLPPASQTISLTARPGRNARERSFSSSGKPSKPPPPALRSPSSNAVAAAFADGVLSPGSMLHGVLITAAPRVCTAWETAQFPVDILDDSRCSSRVCPASALASMPDSVSGVRPRPTPPPSESDISGMVARPGLGTSYMAAIERAAGLSKLIFMAWPLIKKTYRTNRTNRTDRTDQNQPLAAESADSRARRIHDGPASSASWLAASRPQAMDGPAPSADDAA